MSPGQHATDDECVVTDDRGKRIVATVAFGSFRGLGITQQNIEFAEALGMEPHRIAIASVPLPPLSELAGRMQREVGLWSTEVVDA